VGYGSPPDHHDVVSHELVYGPFIAENNFHHQFEVLVEHLQDTRGAHVLAHGCETADVGKEHRREAVFPTFLHFECPGNDQFRKVR